MKRRDFLKALVAVFLSGSVAPEALAGIGPGGAGSRGPEPRNHLDDHIRDYLYKMHHFNEPHPGDVYLDPEQCRILDWCVAWLERLQATIGHGNFQVLSFDHALQIARRFPQVGFPGKKELNFVEMVFYEDAKRYGFFGEKPVKNLTARIKTERVIKIPHTGNYLYRGRARETYEKIKRELGDEVILTSGIRSVVKQLLLFLNKARRNKGNLSLASRSLAPPGFSFHAVGDFDVGQVGLGADNFSERFITTAVYRELSDRGYLRLRYPRDNMLGVRFEPWHVKLT